MKTKPFICLLVGLGVGCATLAAQPTASQDDNVRKLYSGTAAGAAEEAPAAAEEVLPLVQFEEAPLVDVIKTLARQANLNVIFDPQVVAAATDTTQYPPVSLRLENVTAQSVLEAVLNNNNLRLERDLKTKISRVTIKDPAQAEPLALKIYQLKYANPSNLVSILRPTFASPRSQAIPDSRTSQLIVLATEKEQIELEGLLQSLDTATRQVLIEARIVETLKNPRSIKGINWAGTFKEQTFTFGNGNTFGTVDQTKTSDSLSINGAPPSTVTSKSSIEDVTTLIGNGGLTMNTARGFNPSTAFLNAQGVSAVFSWFNEDTDTEVIATPRTVTADNQPAVLSVTRAIPIFRVTTGGTQAGPTVDISYTNLGTILEVTPRISANDNVALKVEPEVSSVEGVDEQILNGATYTANIFNIRRMMTQVLIPSGNTLVIGGLVNDQSQKVRSKVPILGDIPGMKYIFGHSDKQRRKANLLIFITPTIVEDADYQPTASDFLKRLPPVDKPDNEITPFDKPWDGVEPYDWTQPVY